MFENISLHMHSKEFWKFSAGEISFPLYKEGNNIKLAPLTIIFIYTPQAITTPKNSRKSIIIYTCMSNLNTAIYWTAFQMGIAYNNQLSQFVMLQKVMRMHVVANSSEKKND